MPSTVRLGDTRLVTAVRVHEGDENRIDTYISADDGRSWTRQGTVADSGGFNGSAAALQRLSDGRLCLTYGYRAQPYGIRARISADNGKTWSDIVTVRGGGAAWDLGYPRSVQRPDGKIVTIYYFNDGPHTERFVAATIWAPGK
jgi:hypothetical protein